MTPAEARVIAKVAYFYGFTLVDKMRVQHSYFIDKTDPDFKAAMQHPLQHSTWSNQS